MDDDEYLEKKPSAVASGIDENIIVYSATPRVGGGHETDKKLAGCFCFRL